MESKLSMPLFKSSAGDSTIPESVIFFIGLTDFQAETCFLINYFPSLIAAGFTLLYSSRPAFNSVLL